LNNKEEYRLYQLRNLENRLSERADSLRLVAAKVEKEKLVMAKEFECTKKELLAISRFAQGCRGVYEVRQHIESAA
jgi:hypothetical protein